MNITDISICVILLLFFVVVGAVYDLVFYTVFFTIIQDKVFLFML